MMVGVRTAWINLAALLPMEMYLSNVCVLSSSIVRHAALRDWILAGCV